MEIHEQIKQIIEQLGLNNNSFAKILEVTSTTIDSITNGRLQPDGSRKRTKPGFDLLNKIIRQCKINPDYFFGDSNLMFAAKNADKLDLGMPRVITLNDKGEENISYIGVQARAGYLDGYGDPDYIENQPSFNMPMLQNGTFRCFEIKGNSMYNTLCDGDFIFGKFVANFDDIIDGRIYIIVSKKEGVVVKRVINRVKEKGKLILKSDNSDGNYPMYAIDAENILEVWYASMFASKQMPNPVSIYDQLHEIESKLFDLEESHKKTLQNMKIRRKV